ncbi:MAG: Na+ dependent nucleoside transporter [Tannerella sp.]|jgi:CNT family concentrative nucleoside transporter|nr:Na+ dependent nucleoside transporter [Tannerella sp.]
MIESGGFNIESLLRGSLGIFCVLLIAYLFSNDRKSIDWKLVGSGLLLQIVIALSILYVPFISVLFEWMGKAFIKIIDFTQAGVSFLLGPMASRNGGIVFIIHSLPTLIFFTALVSVFYHWGIIQRVVNLLSRVLRFLIRNITGREGLVVVGNIFLGMTESPILVKQYLSKMNRSELFLVMVSGMATIAGTLLGVYAGLLGEGDPVRQVFFAKHLLSASVMAVPGAIIMAKMIYPQTESIDKTEVEVSIHKEHRSVLEALASGTSIGIKLMVNVAAMLLVFIALIAMVNYLSEGIIGRYTGLNEWVVNVTNGKEGGLTIQFILGILLAPLMWLIGVPVDDLMTVGALVGQKTVLNEFVAYLQMQQWNSTGVFIYEKSVVMSTYLLCGFANIASVGMLLGGLGILAPDKRPLIAQLGFRSMFAGAAVSILSATIIGMITG